MSSRGKTPTKRKGKQPAPPRKNKFDTNNPTTFKEAVAKCDLGEFKDGMFLMPGDEVKSIPEDMRAGLEDMSRGPLKIRDFKDGYFIERSVSEPVDVRKARKPSSTTPDQENLLPEEEFLLPPQHFLSTQAKSADPSHELGSRSVQDFILQHTIAAAPNVQSLPRPIPSAMLEPVRSSSSSSSLRSVSPPQHHSHYAAGSYSNSPHPSTLPAPSFNNGERLSPPFPSSGSSSSLPQPSPVMLHRPAFPCPLCPLSTELRLTLGQLPPCLCLVDLLPLSHKMGVLVVICMI